MRGTLAVAVTALTVAVVMDGCRKKTEATAGATGTVAGKMNITDDQITAYLTWTRDWADLAQSHAREASEVAERVARKYSLGDTKGVASDPELLATVERQRTAMQEHMDHNPLSDPQLQAIHAVIDGLIPSHDERKLSSARATYGDRFVNRVVARESDIRAVLLPH